MDDNIIAYLCQKVKRLVGDLTNVFPTKITVWLERDRAERSYVKPAVWMNVVKNQIEAWESRLWREFARSSPGDGEQAPREHAVA